MKVLFVSDNAKLSNPFVETLIAGLYEFNLDCTASIKEWWANVEEYDIIHFQWPEIVFYWEHIRTKDLQEMEMQLQKAKSLGIKIVITCHNLKPHLKRNQDMVALYQLIYEYCDAFVHMGEYSFKLLQSDYPQAKHFIIPHHLYELNSTCKCNRILINILFKFFVWREVSKSFTRSIIEFIFYPLNLFVGYFTKVLTLWDILPDKPVGVFIGTTFP